MGTDEKLPNPQLSDVSVMFMQDPDTSDGESIGCQDIEFTAVDTGDGFFYRIKTERWAFDDEKELVALFRRFKKMLKAGGAP